MVQRPDSPVAWSAIVDDLDVLAVALVAMTARAIYEVSGETSLLQWRAIVELHAAGPLRLGELAAHLPSSTPAASRLVGRMAVRGLLETRPVPADGRGITVQLSAAGHALRTAVIDRRRDLIAQSLGSRSMPAAVHDGLLVLGERLRAGSLAPVSASIER